MLSFCNVDDDNIIGLDLCTNYGIDAVDFVEQWMAFSVSNLQGAEPTLDYLTDMERKELANAKASKGKQSDRFGGGQREAEMQKLKIYGTDLTTNVEDGDFMDSYVCKTPKVSVFFFFGCENSFLVA